MSADPSPTPRVQPSSRMERTRAPRHRPILPIRVVRGVIRRIRVLTRGHRIWQVVVDAAIITVAWYAAFYVRFASSTPSSYSSTMAATIGWVVAIKVGVFVVSGMYDKWWRYLSVKDIESVLKSIVLGSAGALLYVWLARPRGASTLPRSVVIFDFAFTLAGIVGVRFVARSFFERPNLGRSHSGPPDSSVLVVGAGAAGRVIIREMQRQPLGLVPVGLLDDDERKRHMRLDGVPVLGTTMDIVEAMTDIDVDEVVIAIPSASGSTIQRIVDACRAASLPCRILPSINELVLGDMQNLTGQLRDVQVEDVLGREPIRLDLKTIADYLTDQVVLITGAGGSIGSELCRQIARVNPDRMILVEHAENNLFTIEQELKTERGFTRVIPVLADCGNAARMRSTFERYRPTVVFHAAAYKHVGMMESNPVEAVRNNAFGTRTMCEAAEAAGVERFVLVSTDKAVEPKTVMGQSKALCEWIVQSFAARSFRTRFMAVRFGNVLGSSGSVVPIFRRQIERGGPVTVTHEDMTRFFMTIPEAAQLIVQAGAIGDGGEVFVLDMGEPVRIMDLARNMIELSGLVPGVDIDIEVTGIRPAEKLDEDLWAGDEEPAQTAHPKIWRCASSYELDADALLEELDEIRSLVDNLDAEAMATRLRAMLRPRIDVGARNFTFTEGVGATVVHRTTP